MKLKVSRKKRPKDLIFWRRNWQILSFGVKKVIRKIFFQFTMCNFKCVKILNFYVSRLVAIAQKHKITLLLDSKGKSEWVKMF